MTRIIAGVIFLTFVGFTAASSAHAAGGGSSPGGSDGCGLGWQVTDKKTMLGTSTRGTTNGFIPPTFGMTSGTIGCEQHSIAKKEAPAAAFAVANFQTLTNELAQGNGETVMSLAYLMGCPSASDAFRRAVQSRFDSVSNANSGIELYRGVRGIVTSDAVLSRQCVAVL